MKTDILLEKCNWSLLRIFRVIVQEGSLNKAANKLFLTQSAISQSLKRLEEQIGDVLIIRTGGKFHLTPTGEIIFEASLTIYNHLIDYEERLNTEKNSLTGTIKLLVLSRIESARYDRVLHDFHENIQWSTFRSMYSEVKKYINCFYRKCLHWAFVLAGRCIPNCIIML